MGRRVVRVKPVSTLSDNLDGIIQAMQLDELRKLNESPAEREARESAEVKFEADVAAYNAQRAARKAARKALASMTPADRRMRAVAGILVSVMAVGIAALAITASAGEGESYVPIPAPISEGTSPAGTHNTLGETTPVERQREADRIADLLGWNE